MYTLNMNYIHETRNDCCLFARMTTSAHNIVKFDCCAVAWLETRYTC